MFRGGLRPRLWWSLLLWQQQQDLAPAKASIPLLCPSRLHSTSTRDTGKEENDRASRGRGDDQDQDHGEFKYSKNLWERKALAKGYFFAVDEVRDTGGKLFECSRGLIPTKIAVDFPQLAVTRPADKTEVRLLDALRGTNTDTNTKTNTGIIRPTPKNTLMGIYFRENAKSQLKSWTEGYTEKHGFDPAGLRVVELSCVDSLLFRVGPLRNVILRGLESQARARGEGNPIQYFAAFGSLPEFRQRLDIHNRLSAFCFLLDGEQRVRWKGCGEASGEELDELNKAVLALS